MSGNNTDISGFFVGKKYQQKINFNIFKKIETFENNAFITFVSKGIPSEYDFLKILELLEPEQKLLVSVKETPPKYISESYKTILLYENPKDFHSLFNTYIYYHTGYFDPHPRLQMECMFYNKKIIYINEHNIKDGSYFRNKYITDIKMISLE